MLGSAGLSITARILHYHLSHKIYALNFVDFMFDNMISLWYIRPRCMYIFFNFIVVCLYKCVNPFVGSFSFTASFPSGIYIVNM